MLELFQFSKRRWKLGILSPDRILPMRLFDCRSIDIGAIFANPGEEDFSIIVAALVPSDSRVLFFLQPRHFPFSTISLNTFASASKRSAMRSSAAAIRTKAFCSGCSGVSVGRIRSGRLCRSNREMGVAMPYLYQFGLISVTTFFRGLRGVGVPPTATSPAIGSLLSSSPSSSARGAVVNS